MKEELWLKKIKERLDNYAENLPDNGWERLERALREADGAAAGRRKQARVVSLRRWAAAAAAALLVGVSAVSLWLLSGPAGEEVERLARMPEQIAVPEQVAVPDAPVAVPVNPLPADKKPDGRLAYVRTERHREDILPPDADTSSVQQTEEAPRTHTDEPPRKEQSAPERRRRTSLDLPEPLPREAVKERRRWSLGLSVGGRGTATGSDGLFTPVMNSETITGGIGGAASGNINLSAMANGVIAIPDGQALAFKAGKPYLTARERALTSADHHQPVSAGFSVRKELGKGFSVETGLTYTFLASDLHYEGDPEAVSQKLHYLGIPLRANWNFVDTRLFTLYLSAGGAVEKCVYGKQDGEALSQRPWQFSVLGAVGAQYNLSRRVGVYVEPGVSYYFDDGSSLATLRKEHPCGFTLQAGLRLTY